jgi:hypothetical protein
MTTIETVRGASGVGAAGPLSEDSGDVGGDGGTLLPAPGQVSMGAMSMTTLAQLLVRADCQDRTAARSMQDAADSNTMKAESQRVAEMNDKADQDSSQALASGLGDVAGGALVATSGFASDGASANGQHDGTSWRLVAEGTGKVLPGIGTIVAGGHKAEADRDDGRAAMFEAQAQMAIRRYGVAGADAQAASDSIFKVQELLQSIQQTTSESRSAAASELKG